MDQKRTQNKTYLFTKEHDRDDFLETPFLFLIKKISLNVEQPTWPLQELQNDA